MHMMYEEKIIIAHVLNVYTINLVFVLMFKQIKWEQRQIGNYYVSQPDMGVKNK